MCELVATSLQANKETNAGLVYVRRLLRRIDTSVSLATLDVRQHALCFTRWLPAVWMTRIGWALKYGRRKLLANALEKDLGPAVELDALGKRQPRRVRRDHARATSLWAGAVGYFIVSGATAADDVLAALLCSLGGRRHMTSRQERLRSDIAPQFESLSAPRAVWRDDAGAFGGSSGIGATWKAHGRTQCV